MFLIELYHKRCILIRAFINKSDGMEVDSLIEDHIADLSLGLAGQVAQFIIMEEEKFKLDAIVLHELKVVSPVGAFLAGQPHHRAVSADVESILD